MRVLGSRHKCEREGRLGTTSKSRSEERHTEERQCAERGRRFEKMCVERRRLEKVLYIRDTDAWPRLRSG
jgi:hypothetical protein